MNETYEWLYDHYAQPQMRIAEQSEAIKAKILRCSGLGDTVLLRDSMEDLCLLWGTEAFSLGLQLGLRLMAGQRAEGLTIL